MTTSWWLYDHPNPHAPVRANGIRFHGYPQRQTKVRLIVVHTAENTPDTVGDDGGAEAVARYQARVERPSSYHLLVDSDSAVPMLPDQAVAFGARGANADGWHLSFATRAHLWSTKPAWWADQALELAAAEAGPRAKRWGIPLRRLTRGQIADGRTPGFAAHADTEAVFGTPGRRSDPGSDFDWDDFLDRITRPAPGPAPDLMETLMATELVDAHEQLADATEAQAAAAWMPHVARARAQAGAEPSAASDFQWAVRLVRGEARLLDAYNAIVDAA